MKLDQRVQLIWAGTAIVKQGVEDVQSLMGVHGTVIDKDGDDIQVNFEFDSGQYHAIQVWVDQAQLTG